MKIFRRNYKGSVTAEFVLAMPILLGMLFFVIEVGNLLYISNSMNVIARSVARYASISPTTPISGLLTQAVTADSVPDPSKVSLSITPAPGATRNVGDQIIVVVTYAYTPFINPFHLFNSSKSWAPVVKGKAISRVEVAA